MNQPLTPLALENAPVLRALAQTTPPSDLFGLDEFAGRRRDSVERTLDRLESDGLLSRDGEAAPRLTDAGLRAVRALDVAEGRIALPERAVAVLHGDLVPHPDNPRKHFDPQSIADLADTIEADDGNLIEPLVVGRPGGAPDGKRYLYAGERRFKALTALIVTGRRPADKPIAAEERDDAPGLIFLLSLVENGQREDLTELERARALHALGQARNWEAPRIAKETGVDLRTVQQSLQVVAKGTEEAFAAYAEDGNWERLRSSVQERKVKTSLELTPKLTLALMELAYAIDTREGCPVAGGARIIQPAPGGPWQTLRDRALVEAIFVGDGRMYAKLGAPVRPWLAEVGYETDATSALRKARAAVVGELQAASLGPDEMASEWLNLSREPPTRSATETIAQAQLTGRAPLAAEPVSPLPPATPDDGVRLYADMAGKALEPPPREELPLAQDTVKLDEDEALILIEVAYKLRQQPVAAPGRGFSGAAATSAYRDDRTASVMVMERRAIAFVNGPGNSWIAYPQKAGWAWLQARGLAEGEMSKVAASDRFHAMVATGTSSEVAEQMCDEGMLATAWLRPEEPAPAETAVASQPSAEQELETAAPPLSAPPPASPSPTEAREAEARLVLQEVQSSTAEFANVLDSLFRATGVTGPLTAAGDMVTDATGAVLLAIDADGGLPDDLVHARALLVARALNAAVLWGRGT